jgi:hypothetical protein
MTAAAVVSMRLLSGREITTPWPPEHLNMLKSVVLKSDPAYGIKTVVRLFLGDKELKNDDDLLTVTKCPDFLNVILEEWSSHEYLYEDLWINIFTSDD